MHRAVMRLRRQVDASRARRARHWRPHVPRASRAGSPVWPGSTHGCGVIGTIVTDSVEIVLPSIQATPNQR